MADDANNETQTQIRDRVTRLAFAGDPERYNEFIRVLSESTPDGVDVILRGSSVTGHKFGSDEPFDGDGPGTSDLDVTFVGGDMVMLRQRLCEMTGRSVNLQATTSLVQYLRDVALDQPYLVLLKKPKAD